MEFRAMSGVAQGDSLAKDPLKREESMKTMEK